MTLTHIGQTHWIKRGEQIERARNWIGYSQEELADLLSELLGYKISRQIIYTLEQGKRDWRGDERAGLAYLLQQSESWLDCKPDAPFNDQAKRNGAKGVWLRSEMAFAA